MMKVQQFQQLNNSLSAIMSFFMTLTKFMSWL